MFSHTQVLLLLFSWAQCRVGVGRFEAEDWSDWSAWTRCSRSCDGGVTQQFRKCKSSEGCHGVSIRSRMCNMQPCAQLRHDRTEQCKAFNGRHFKGRPNNWEAAEEAEDSCTLFCRVEGSVGTEAVVKMGKVREGTRCGTKGALHVCVNGKCESVGCDLKIGSPKKVDECGVCGGDGGSCTSPVYRWDVVGAEDCDAECGGGVQITEVVCVSNESGERVDPALCEPARKPYRGGKRTCNIHPCQPKWWVGDWSVCSQSCGSAGIRMRKVLCLHEKNKTGMEVADNLCKHKVRPNRQEPCNQTPCSQWHVGPWSNCSAECGNAWKTRNVVCRDMHNLPSWTCDKRLQPSDKLPCVHSHHCPTQHTLVTEDVLQLPPSIHPSSVSDGSYIQKCVHDVDRQANAHLAAFEEVGREHTLPLMEMYPPLDSRRVLLDGGGDSSVLVDENAIPSEPTKVRVYFACGWLFLSFVVDGWSSCSETCGQGLQTRQVKCKIFLEFSRTIANLPDKECPGPKPVETQSCFSRPCQKESEDSENLSDSQHAALADSDSSTTYRKTISVGLPPGISMSDMTFSWKVLGYSPCSASCLGGIQEAMIQCVRDYDQRIATPVLCMDKPQPDIATTRTCNDHSCPPRWNVSDFGSCTKKCGGGVQTREVNCIHEVTRGNTVIVPPDICPQPQPRTEILCNTVNCPPYWESGEWSRCSRKCGGGERKRKVVCKQVIALGHVVEWPNGGSHCTLVRPSDSRSCNKQPCLGRNKWDEYSFVMDQFKSKLSLTLRGTATVFNGVQLKLKCPNAKGPDPLVWMKGHQFLSVHQGKLQLLNNNILKIFNLTFSDSGVYTCLLPSGQAISNLTLMVRPYDGEEGHRPLSTLYADEERVSVPMWDVMITPNSEIFSGSCCCGHPRISLVLSLFLFVLAVLSWRRGEAIDPSQLLQPRRTNKKAASARCNRKISCAKEPSWKVGNWSSCSTKLCFNWNSGRRTRSVECHFENGTAAAAEEECLDSRPLTSEECYSAECVAEWQPGEWSKCMSGCGSLGVRTRVLSCVWHGSGLPAGGACLVLSGEARPGVWRVCRSPRCMLRAWEGGRQRR